MRVAIPHLLLLALLLPTPGTAGHGPQALLPTAEIQVGDIPLTVEVANESHEREHGLMFRKTLPDGQGMLFVYPRERRRVFWMHETTLPLDAGFIAADGRLNEIVALEPLSEIPITSRLPASYVLEVPRGWFSRHGFGPGTQLSNLP